MKRQFFLLSCFITLIISCKTLHINSSQQLITPQQVSLGSIGIDKDFILQSEFKKTAIPNYKNPIKVSVESVEFTKATHKAF